MACCRHTGSGHWEEAKDRLSVAVNSFSGEVHRVRVEKKSGMEDARLLYSEEETTEREETHGSVWDTLSRYRDFWRHIQLLCHNMAVPFSFMGGSTRATGDGSVGQNETINVFSIASGHLYERFLR